MELMNKVALVTGASRGIGRAIALALAAEGCRLAITARNADRLEQIAEALQRTGSTVRSFPADMRREDDIRGFVRGTAEAFGGIDILVNNAGLGHFRRIAELTTAEWDEMFDVNIRGLFIATREALPYLRKAGESAVINVASLAGKNAFERGGGYAATKHAVLAFSRCLMLEERKNGLRVLAICPGSVATEFSARDAGREGRILQPEEIASSIVFMLKLPQRAMLSEIDIRPTNP